MSLTFGFSSIKDVHAKLLRDAAMLGEEVTSDALFNFVVTGYSMIDWVKNDPSVPSGAKTKIEVESLFSDQWLKICGDLATAVKHFTLTQRTPITSSATSGQGFGVGRFGKGAFGIGEEGIDVNLMTDDASQH